MNGKLPTGPSQCDFPVNMPIGREPQRAKHARGIELNQNIELWTLSHTGVMPVVDACCGLS